MRWPSHASHYTNRIYELLLTWSTSSFIAKLVKERERIFLHLMHGEMTPRFLVALFTNQIGCTCMAACSRWEVQLPFSHPWQTPTQESKGKWPYVTAHLSKLWNAAFATSSHKLLSLSLQQHDLMWRKKGGKKTNHSILSGYPVEPTPAKTWCLAPGCRHGKPDSSLRSLYVSCEAALLISWSLDLHLGCKILSISQIIPLHFWQWCLLFSRHSAQVNK